MTSAQSNTDEIIRVGKIEIRYLLDGKADGHVGMFEMTVPPKSNVPPPHSHSGQDELIYGLEGMLRYSVDGLVRDLGPGDSMFSPRGSVHGFSNPHDKAARVLTTLSPDIGAQYFRDVGDVANAGGPPDRTKILEIMTRYGLIPAMPAAGIVSK